MGLDFPGIVLGGGHEQLPKKKKKKRIKKKKKDQPPVIKYMAAYLVRLSLIYTCMLSPHIAYMYYPYFTDYVSW